MIIKLLTDHRLEFLSLKGGCRGSSESTLVKISNCWKSHVAAQMFFQCLILPQEQGISFQEVFLTVIKVVRDPWKR